MTTLLAEPRGKGYVRAANELRVDIPAHEWQSRIGTDYWLMAGSADLITASALAVTPNASGLDSYGWTTTTMGFTNTVTADFMSSADDTPPNFNGADAGDVLASPIIFGNYSHRLAVGQLLGYLPTRLIVDFYAAFTVASETEANTYIGLDNGSFVAVISSDGGNFVLDNASAQDPGIAIDNAYHHWRIKINSADSLMTWYVDGVSQGTLAVAADQWPVGFKATSVAAGINRQAVSWAHIWYE